MFIILHAKLIMLAGLCLALEVRECPGLTPEQAGVCCGESGVRSVRSSTESVSVSVSATPGSDNNNNNNNTGRCGVKSSHQDEICNT